MKRRGGAGGGGGHGAAGGASSGRDGEGKLRIHLKRSCTDRKLVQGDTALGLTTDDWHKFKKLLASKTFAVHDTKRIRGENLTAEWAKESGFREPVIAPDKGGMGLKVPDSSFTVADVARVVGEDKAIRPIHVGEQANIDQSMTLAEFAEYFETCTKPGQAILNMISLEFSDTPLARMVQSPQLVRDMDWLNRCWPADRMQEGQFPKVQYYCLMSQGGSYTDFHVDFGGTSVWYHILRGKKEFLLIRPTKKNLELYEGWISSPTQSQIFFGDLADICYRVVLDAGETLMIPSGWIHAVFTPKPSLVFGGNFLHSLNIPMQLQVHGIETRAKIHSKFRFPYLKEMMFFAASNFLNTLREQQGKLERTGTNIPRSDKGATPDKSSSTVGLVEEQKHGAEEAGGTTGSAMPKNGAGNDAENGARVSLSSWERDGLRPLLEACRAWMKEEEEGEGGSSDEEGVPEEWNLAAASAGCADVNAMLSELDRRVSALGEEATADSPSTSAGKAADTAIPPDSNPPMVAGTDGSTNISSDGSVDGSGATANGAADHVDPGSGSGAAALLLAAAATATLEADAGGGTQTASAPSTSPGLTATPPDGPGDDEEEGDGPRVRVPGRGYPTPEDAAAAAAAAASSYSIPKLKLSIKPQQDPSSSSSSPRASSSSRGGSGGKAGGAGLKLVLKGPALSSAGGSAGSSGGSASVGRARKGGGGGGVSTGKKRGRQPQQRQQQREERRWKEDYDDSDEFETRDDSDEEEEEDEDEEEDEEEEEEEEEEDSGDDTRVGRGGKRKARPLGSRLRAIARLGDDAAAGDSEDDNSADEYKPDDGDDDVLPEDHKIYADELPRETKKGKSSSGVSGGRPRNAWSGFGTGAGGGARAAGSGAAGPRGKVGVAVIGGVQRRLSVTKQEALRSKGVFKIAPPSKVPPKPKEKKPLTAKQKLMAKMRR